MKTEVLISTGCLCVRREDPYELAGGYETGGPTQGKVMCLRRKWRMADGGWRLRRRRQQRRRAAGRRADSFEQMDEVSLRLPTVRRGPQQPGRCVAEAVAAAAGTAWHDLARRRMVVQAHHQSHIHTTA